MIFEDVTALLRELGSEPRLASFRRDAEIIRAGEQGGVLYVVRSGEVEIRQGDLSLDTVESDGIVGEMALVDGSLRSATVIAKTDVQLLPVDKEQFQHLLRRYPDFGMHVMKIMSLRLRLMNTRFSDAMTDVSLREEVEAQLRELATLDPLTGILNRRHFHVSSAQEVGRAARHGRPLSVLMLDIDHFKRVNDSHGHACGDESIKQVVRAVQGELRTSDVFGRLGGEEFAVLLTETDAGVAASIAERIRTRIESASIDCGGQSFSVTASIGVGAWTAEEKSIDAALGRADAALYQAKNAGRNRVV